MGCPVTPSDPFNTYLVRTYKSGKQAYARLDRASGLSAKGVASETSVSLSAAEASWMWWIWPAESPERPETRQTRIGFLLASEDERAALIDEAEARYVAENAAELAREAEAAEAAQRDEEERERAARDEILALGIFRDGYLPKSVRRGVWVSTIANQSGMLGIWHHPEHDLTILSKERDLNPGPGWEFVNAYKADAERAERIWLNRAN